MRPFTGAAAIAVALALAAPPTGASAAQTLPGSATPAGAVSVLCRSTRQQVVRWVRQHHKGRDRTHIVSITGGRQVVNRFPQSPSSGVLLACRGRAKLSNGDRAAVVFGVRAVGGAWYLFLKRPHRRR